MSRIPRWLLIPVTAAAGLVLLSGVAFGVDRTLHSGEVLRNVWVGEARLSGLSPERAEQELLALEDRLLRAPRTFVVDGQPFELDPQVVGLDLQEDRARRSALVAGRQGSLFDQFRWWVAHLRRRAVVAVPVALDGAALEEVFQEWESEAIEDPPYPGAVLIEDARPVPDYPKQGRAIDRTAATEVVRWSLSRTRPGELEIPVATVDPVLDRQDVDQAVQEAIRLLAGSVTLVRDDPEVEVTFTADQLASALRSRVATASEPQLVLSFDPQVVTEILRPLRQELEVPPRDAQFIINDDDTVSVLPGRHGTRIDPERTAAALFEAASGESRTARFPFEEGAPPEFTTEDAEALGIRRKVSEFTTQHRCCEPRVHNIHLIADLVDGAIVEPGETFSLNEYVGKRTADRGFVSAPVIYAGEYTEDIGGGVSQFATTFYNAVFFGGYEDVEHQPHSYYISRYPEGREATISWPRPDLVFRNDSEAGVLIKTSYTDTSITVAFYGDNVGRQVEAGLSGRFNFTDPPIEYRPDPSLTPEEEKVLEKGAQGWTVVVYRTITYPDGRVVEEDWPVRYRPQPRVVAVHPCRIPPGEEGHTGEPCPEPTTEETTTTTTTEGGGE